MAMTGAQKYPGANLTYWYQSRYPGSAMEVNVGVIHTTEGTTVPAYGGGSSAPNFTALPDIPGQQLVWYQHFDFDVSSRALRNEAGGVETNTLNCAQVELVGTCDPTHRTSWSGRRAGLDYLYWPDAPDWALAELGAFVRWCHDEHGIPMTSTVTWLPYPSSYGTNGVRLSGSAWRGYYGWLGHQHVPENDHGDPGNLDFARVLNHARGIATSTAPQEDDMPTAEEIAKAVWAHTVPVRGSDLAADSVLRRAYTNALDSNRGVATLTAQVGALTAAVTALAQGGGLTVEQVTAAAEVGARTALAELGQALTDAG